MSKLRLKLDHLRVESFDTLPAPRGRGTVLGHSAFGDAALNPIGAGDAEIGNLTTITPAVTQWQTCPNTCGDTCQSCASACIPTACGTTCPVQVCDPAPSYAGCTTV